MNATLLADVQSMLARHGVDCHQFALVSPPGSGRKQRRAMWRATRADGSLMKVRLLENEDAAKQLVTHRLGVPGPFVPVLARYDAVLIEPWIDGVDLTTAAAESRAKEVGAILGSLHAARTPATPLARDTEGRAAHALEQIATLVGAGVLAADLAERLRSELRANEPQEVRQTLVHLDYCPESLVVDPRGALHVIDNEWIRVGTPGLDLGRTYARWGMRDDVWRRFFNGYLSTAPGDPGPLRFWFIVMAVRGAALRVTRAPAERAVPLARLVELAATAQV